MKIKLKSGKEVTLRDVSVDEKDEMLDSCEWIYNAKGKPTNMKNMNKTLTKWIRLGLDDDASDNFLKTLSLQDRTEIFVKLQENLMVGEGKASK